MLDLADSRNFDVLAVCYSAVACIYVENTSKSDYTMVSMVLCVQSH